MDDGRKTNAEVGMRNTHRVRCAERTATARCLAEPVLESFDCAQDKLREGLGMTPSLALQLGEYGLDTFSQVGVIAQGEELVECRNRGLVLARHLIQRTQTEIG